ncbi:hypothetical protein M9Y10_040580 [Tritrichomonas musculus]|uniref:Uncharacterized protein n=1 Tax=Tritrichomonas musculus TaxID=1915356 RepID=A0ABR2GR86_9EUKA
MCGFASNLNKLFPLHSKHIPTAVEVKVVLYLISVLMRILVFKEIDPNCFVNDYTTLLYACTKNGIDIV